MENVKHIRKLLDRYYEGQTTLEEEKQLTDFFLNEKVPADLIPEKEFFAGVAGMAQETISPEGLDDRIRSAIEAEERRELKVRRINWFSLSGLAAGLAVILTVYLTVIKQGPDQYATGTFEDPREAYEETLKVLSYVSGKWNDGTRELQNLQQVNKTLNAVRPLQKINSGSKQLQLLGNLEKAKNL